MMTDMMSMFMSYEERQARTLIRLEPVKLGYVGHFRNSTTPVVVTSLESVGESEVRISFVRTDGSTGWILESPHRVHWHFGIRSS